MMFSVFNIETLIFKINRIDFSDKINYICDKNGSGKTLFLDSLYFDNKVKIEPHIDKKDIIYLSQHFSFYERIKVKDFIEFFDQINNENLLEKIRKNSYINNFINENFDKTLYHLSGGEFKFLYLILLLFTDKKLYLLGHSMGSMIARLYLRKSDILIDKLLLTGTVPRASISGLGLFFARVACFYFGEMMESDIIDTIVGAGKGLDFISYDQENIRIKNNDPMRIFKFKISYTRVLIELNRL